MSGFNSTTAADLINDTARKLGVLGAGEALKAHEATAFLRGLNNMLDSWSVERAMISAVSTSTFSLTGAQSYSIGIGQDFDIERPVDIDRVTPGFVSVDGVDYPLTAIDKSEFDSISLKNITTPFGGYVAYDPQTPYPTVSFFPIPSGTVTLRYLTPLQLLETMAEELNMPPGYGEAIIYNLAMRMHPEFPEVPLNPVIPELANQLKAQLKRKNTRPRRQALNTSWSHGVSGCSGVSVYDVKNGLV